MKQLQAKFIVSAEKLSQCPDFQLPEFALLGRSNVGKSSFINALANNKKIAKTSNTPGKTRLINFFNFSDKCNGITAGTAAKAIKAIAGRKNSKGRCTLAMKRTGACLI